jgi:putative ABC transport system permease protein
MHDLMLDARYAVRMLTKSPGFAIAAVLALALGIGANSTVFSLVNAILLRTLPFEDPDRLVMVWESNQQQGRDEDAVAPANYLDWKNQNNVFEDMAASRNMAFILTGTDEPERLLGTMANASLFSVLGVNPILGRPFAPQDEQPGAGRVVLLSYGIWERVFGSSPSIIGQPLTLNNQPFTVIGVMPREFRYPDTAELWIPPQNVVPDPPLKTTGDISTVRGSHYLRVIARMAPNVTLQQAQTEMGVIAARLQEQYPATNNGQDVKLVPLQKQIVGDIGPALVILLGAVVLVLLIACANVANLLLARASGRQKEIAIRVALGAGRSRIIRQLLTESIILAVLGGVVGILLAYLGLKFLVAFNPGNIPRLNEVSIDGWMIGFTFLISLVTGIIFGLTPAFQASKPDLNQTLKEESRGSAGSFKTRRMRTLLVVSEIALTQVLLICAGLLVRSFIHLQEIDPGFNPKNVLTMQIPLPGSKYPDGVQQAAFFQQVLQRVEQVQGVQSAGVISRLPLTGGSSVRGFLIEGRQPPPDQTTPEANYQVMSPDYFRTMGIPLLRGRVFTEMDSKDAPGVVILNETLAKLYWPNEDPVGQHLSISSEQNPREIVGVVKDVKQSALNDKTKPELYVPYVQVAWPSMVLVVRTQGNPMNLARTVRSEILGIDRNQPVSSIRPLEEVIADSTSRQRFNTILLAIFAGVALVLASVGVYGVMAYLVSQRRREIGIRLALGAQPGTIFKLVIWQGLAFTLIGLAIGVGAAFAFARLLVGSSLVYGVTATDPAIFLGVPLLLTAVAMTACYLPARRAMGVNPVIALREE